MKKLILRCDDFGTASGTNRAICQLARSDLNINVSVMVCTPGCRSEVEKLRELSPTLSLGVHLAVNAEWEKIKWGPVGKPSRLSGLVDERGYFHTDATPLLSVDAEVILQEVRAQVSEALKWGVAFSYMDEHMGFGWLPQIAGRLPEIAKEFGLIYRLDIPTLGIDSGETALLSRWRSAIQAMDEKPRLFVTHPSFADESTKHFSNANVPDGVIARERQEEMDALSSSSWRNLLLEQEVSLLTYRDVAL